MGKKKIDNDSVLAELRKSVSNAPEQPVAVKKKDKTNVRIVKAEFLRIANDQAWEWEEYNGGLRGILDSELLKDIGEFGEADTIKLQVSVTRNHFEITQVVAHSLRRLDDKQRRERIRDLRRRHAPPEAPKKITHLNAEPPPGPRRVVRAVVTAINATHISWHALNGNEAMTSHADNPVDFSLAQEVNVVLEDRNGEPHFVDFVAHTLQPRQLDNKVHYGELLVDAMYVLEPGDVVDAFLSFTGTPGSQDSGRDGKTRPAVFIAKRGTTLLLRGLSDGTASYAQRSGNISIRDWHEAGLTKPSVVQEFDQEVEIIDVWATRGRLSAFDRRVLGIV